MMCSPSQSAAYSRIGAIKLYHFGDVMFFCLWFALRINPHPAVDDENDLTSIESTWKWNKNHFGKLFRNHSAESDCHIRLYAVVLKRTKKPSTFIHTDVRESVFFIEIFIFLVCCSSKFMCVRDSTECWNMKEKSNSIPRIQNHVCVCARDLRLLYL